MDKKSIAAQLYTLREFLKTPEDIKKSLGKVKEIGYSAVQVSGIGQIDPFVLKDIVNELDLNICATHTSYERLQQDLKNVIKEHQLWNCRYVGIGSLPKAYSRDREGFTRFAKEASILGRELAENGLKLIYHNHDFEFERHGEATAMDILMSESDSDKLGFEIDTYWVQAGGGSPVSWLKKVAGRIDVVHFKDMALTKGKQTMAEIGEGNLDWESIIDVCREINVKWYAVEQDVCARDPFESLEISFKYLQKYLMD
ncbi:MAG TPA: sugar phosphate isomerase/epimerase [Ruminiclostridium sp.]